MTANIITPDGRERIFSTNMVVVKNGLLFFNAPEQVGTFNLRSERWIKEGLSAALELILGLKYAHHEKGLHLKFDPTKSLPANMQSAGYISHEYSGVLFPTPQVPGWHEISIEMWTAKVAENALPYEKGEQGEKRFITRARWASQKAMCMDLLISGTSLVATGPFFKNLPDGTAVWDTDGKTAFVNYVGEVMSQPTREAMIALSNEHYFGSVENKRLNAVTAQAMSSAEPFVAPQTIIVGGQPVAVSSIIGKGLEVFKANGFFVRGVHVASDADLQKVAGWISQGYVLNFAPAKA